MKINVRPAVMQDYDAIMKIYREVSELNAEMHPELFGKMKDYVIPSGEFSEILEGEKSVTCVAVMGNEIVGFAFADIRTSFVKDEPVLNLGQLGVLSKYRHYGIGHKIIEYLEQVAKDNGCVRVELNVYNNNISAKKFYEKLGYTPQRIRLEKNIK